VPADPVPAPATLIAEVQRARDSLPERHLARSPSLHLGRGPHRALAVQRAQQLLAEADALGRELDQLVVLDVLERVLEREVARRRDRELAVRGGRAHVRELLLAADVDRD